MRITRGRKKMLTLRQIEDICLVDEGANQCRYLAEDSNSNFYCIKKTGKKPLIDAEVEEFKKKQKSLGLDPKTLGVPLGDNCQGYIFFRHKTQGYDVS
jgi:hypothetical protein